MAKQYRISAERLEQLVPHRGACVATDRILVDGAPVGVMYREDPDFDADGGWRFLAGDEDEAYMNEVEHHGVYCVNTLANYDRDIIRFLLLPPGSRVERRGGELSVVEGPQRSPEPELLPAAGPGSLELEHGFQLELSAVLWRRIEDGCLVLWKEGLTCFVSTRRVTSGDLEAPIEDYLDKAAADRRDQQRASTTESAHASYHLDEVDEDGAQSSLNGAISTRTGFLHCILYYDDEDTAREAADIWHSLTS